MLHARRSRATRTLTGALLVLAAAVAPSACSSTSTASGGSTATRPAGASAVRMSVDEVAALIADPPGQLVILDVRTPGEFAAGHLAGAVPMDVQGGSFTASATLLDHSLHYVVYCESGSRSAQAVRLLGSLGFQHLYELEGGIAAWRDAGRPLVRG